MTTVFEWKETETVTTKKVDAVNSTNVKQASIEPVQPHGGTVVPILLFSTKYERAL
jgi:hypothetical protein